MPSAREQASSSLRPRDFHKRWDGATAKPRLSLPLGQTCVVGGNTGGKNELALPTTTEGWCGWSPLPQSCKGWLRATQPLARALSLRPRSAALPLCLSPFLSFAASIDRCQSKSDGTNTRFRCWPAFVAPLRASQASASPALRSLYDENGKTARAAQPKYKTHTGKGRDSARSPIRPPHLCSLLSVFSIFPPFSQIKNFQRRRCGLRSKKSISASPHSARTARHRSCWGEENTAGLPESEGSRRDDGTATDEDARYDNILGSLLLSEDRRTPYVGECTGLFGERQREGQTGVGEAGRDAGVRVRARAGVSVFIFFLAYKQARRVGTSSELPRSLYI